jgi:hypothetical protein
LSLSPCLLLTQSGHPLRRAECLLSEAKPTPWRRIRRFELYGRERPERSWIAASNAGFKCVDICEIRRIGSGLLLQIDLLFVRDLSTGNIIRRWVFFGFHFGKTPDVRYWHLADILAPAINVRYWR